MPPTSPAACPLPCLDPTPMGWTHRDWFTVRPWPHPRPVRHIGPTVWWHGELIGSWASTPGGIRTHLLADRGRQAAEAVERAAADLHARLEGATVVPAIRTPCERHLSNTL
nr:crosslink repair DNA glycosylase YcaQ family protein [Actinoplanes consettensis]